MRARGRREINRESYMKDGQIGRGAHRGRCVRHICFLCVSVRKRQIRGVEGRERQLEGARDQREELSEQERARERHWNVNPWLSLTFKMTYFACCYPITNESYTLSECVCMWVYTCVFLSVCMCVPVRVWFAWSVAGMNWGPCYTTDEECVCISKSSGID